MLFQWMYNQIIIFNQNLLNNYFYFYLMECKARINGLEK